MEMQGKWIEVVGPPKKMGLAGTGAGPDGTGRGALDWGIVLRPPASLVLWCGVVQDWRASRTLIGQDKAGDGILSRRACHLSTRTCAR